MAYRLRLSNGQTIDEFKTVTVALTAKWPAEADVIGKAEKMELLSVKQAKRFHLEI